MTTPDIRALAREAALSQAQAESEPSQDAIERIADAVLAAILPAAERIGAERMHATALKACADLVRLVAPDHVEGDVVMREDVVDIAMRLKRDIDAIRALARGDGGERG